MATREINSQIIVEIHMIYDCFTFFNELDLLEVRLNELDEIVDKFVLVEAKRTFQGQPKSLYFDQNKDRFARFEDKIIHIIIDFPEEIKNTTKKKHNQIWLREFYQRDQIAQGLKNAKPNDLIIISDVDEIISAQKLAAAIKSGDGSELTVFEMNYQFGYANRQLIKATKLLGPRMVAFQYFKTGQKLRMSKATASHKLQRSKFAEIHTRIWNYVNCNLANKIRVIPDSVWHMTSLGGWEVWRNKVNSFSHDEEKTGARFLSKEGYFDFIRYETVPIARETLPEYVRNNPNTFPLFEDSEQFAHANRGM
jgi:beta-1,4-mannosyl-glycoprotein beta-1,4-N-acetylglucosaminyltransferase